MTTVSAILCSIIYMIIMHHVRKNRKKIKDEENNKEIIHEPIR